MNALRAELRKIWSVRSTYVMILLLLALPVGLMSFWIFGYKNVDHADQSVKVLMSVIMAVVGIGGVLLSFIPILSVGHEYRYNTVLYTLTSTNNRAKVFFAKWLATILVTTLFAIFMVALGVAAFYLGQQINKAPLLAQTMPDVGFALRMLASIIGAVSFGFIIAMLCRSLVAAIALLLVLPSTIEPLLGLLLKDNVQYLPYTALNNLTATPGGPIAYSTSLWVAALYTVVLGAVALILFMRRDAN